MSDRTLLQFRAGSSVFGLPVASVVEIIRIVAPSPVPDPAPDLVGVINLRGRIVPVFDLCRSLQLGERPLSLRMYIVIADVDGEHIGIIVDDVLDVATIPDAQFQVSRAMAATKTFASGVARINDEMVTVLSLLPLVERARESAAVSDS